MQFWLKTIVIIAIAIICTVGILSAVFVIGGAYQQELFEDYLEDSESPTRNSPSNPDFTGLTVP